jgi:hypothetical protein
MHRASPNHGRTGAKSRESDSGGKEVVAWGSRRCQGRGCRDGGITDLQREGDEGKNRHKRLYMSKIGASACEFNLQDRLGFDQPSKAVECLIKAAIHELPWIDPSAFVVMPDGQQQAGPCAGKQ